MRLLSAISFFFLLSSSAHAQCILSVRGTVNDADTRSPLAGATVTIVELKKTILTDNQGNYSISGICPGDYTLRITHADCQALDFHFHLKEDLVKTFQLSHAENLLKEVVVVGAASVRPEGMTGELKGKELAATRGLSLGESLQRITGVTVLQTGNNIYKPVIQGLHSSRVLILNNGIRQEGQQWGSEHAPEIDPYVANRLTVIKGTFFGVQAAARQMVTQGRGGRIVLSSSVTGVTAMAGAAVYGTSKAALRHLASILGVELGRIGITVNAIAIGATINDRNLADNPEYASLWGTLSPMGRVGTPQDVAQTVRYLCSDAAQLVNGQTLTIDGGWTLTSPLSAGERQQ